jgi:small-conductance mechanosensitive channel
MPTELQEFLAQTYLNNTYQQYLLSFAIFILCIISIWVLKNIFLKKIRSAIKDKAKNRKLENFIIQTIDTISPVFYITVAINIAVRNLNLTNTLWGIINGLTVLVVCFYTVTKIQAIVSFLIKNFFAKRKTEEGEETDQLMANFLSLISKIILWLIALIFILQNFNINITGLVGGLGITGIAVAFALQNVLSDIFASFSIYLDRPFKIGDLITVGLDTGVVKKIGIKSTRIRTLSGEMLIISNKELSQIRIQNFGAIERRRRKFILCLEYSTPSSKIKKAIKEIENIIQKIEICEFERCVFQDFSASSLDLVCSYYVNSSEFDLFAKTNQKINFEIKEMFEKEGINFAFPSQTVYVSKK